MGVKNIFLSSTFFIMASIAFYGAHAYKNHQILEYKQKQFNSIATSVSNEISALIEEKNNATLALALAFTENTSSMVSLFQNKTARTSLLDLSSRIRDNSDFKNIWIQLIDKNGNSISRSWDESKDNNLTLLREDIRTMLKKPEIMTSLSVGKYDLSFKAMVPIFDEKGLFIGFIEIITHFNSIANKIQSKGYVPLIVVDEKYSQHITKPFTQQFVSNNYIANKNADASLMEYLRTKGLENCISKTNTYKVDKELGYLIVNYPIFDAQDKPMANFLIFKNLDEIALESIETIKSIVNLLLILFLLSISFIFYLLSNSDKTQQHERSHLRIAIFTVFYLILAISYYFLLSWNYAQKEKEYLQIYNTNVEKDFAIIYEKYSAIAKTMYQTTINKPEVLELLALAYQSDNEKNSSRKKLHELLAVDYEFLKSHELKQLHFHLKNNESFLRFHRPQRYGDDLSQTRATVAWVNENHKELSGFEEGRIYNGFRHIYPLFQTDTYNEKEYLGSVEVSFSAYPLCKEFTKFHHTKTGFIIDKNAIEEKVFSNELSNYIRSPFSDFYYETDIKKQLEHSFLHFDETLLLQSPSADALNDMLIKGRLFSIGSADRHTLFTFIPVKNPLTHKVSAAFILQTDDTMYSNLRDYFTLFLFLGLAVLLFIFLSFYKEYENMLKFKFLSQKTKKIIDLQQTILVITDTKKLIEANQKFLDFTGFDSLEAFKKSYNCVCDLFEQDDDFFHLKKIKNGANWVDVLAKLPQNKCVVAMRDTQDDRHAFSISISQYDDNYILSFNDISDTIFRHMSLKEKVLKDKLTGAYNREYFENIFPLFLQESQNNELLLGVVIFDIDHFKEVNDTFGHNRGDSVLIELTRYVRASIRQDDVLVRWGGEEFVLLVKTKTTKNLYDVAELVRQTIEQSCFEEVEKLTCSFGISIYQEGEDVSQTINRADKALYIAKEQGRNRVEEFYI
ncbi:MAG: diguanylate cyclase [Sulfurimonas sp.]